jgi:putative SOS response-associated peptidase YedK
MVNRFSLTASANLLAKRFGIEVPEFYKPRFNVAPTQLMPVITSSGKAGMSWFYWGRPPQFAHNKLLGEKIINLRLETLQERPVLKKTLLKNRCIIPADGWYAWKKVGKRTLIPHRFTVTDQTLFSFAGLWEEFEDENGTVLHTFMVLTTPGNAAVSSISERMPILLDAKNESLWLSDEAEEDALFKILTPYPASAIAVYPVSHRINNPEIDHASLIIPAPASDQHGNLTLFD